MLRALRFACRLSFSIEEKTHQALTECALLLSQVASERIGSEVAQIVEAGHIAHAIKLGFPVLTVAIPELLPLQNFDQRSPYHAYDVLEHTARVCSATEAFTAGCATPALRWAALLHDIAKPEMFSVDADGRGHFYGHPEKGAVVAKALFKRLALSQHLSNEVCALVALHDYDVDVTTSSLRHMVALLAEASKSDGIALAYDLLTLKQADALAKANPYRSYAVTLEAMRTLLLHEAKRGIAQRPQELCVSGAEIMEVLSLQPGPAVGVCQRKLFELYLAGQVENRKEDLLAILAQGNW
ncbi:MAG: HD domain-containing protein [Lancefieldella parvula]|uniref:HD domain-containing protein n=1 Tax=Lancefieldella parvula TaxID=1382 RepID=A0A9E7D5X9_9ACTN|nr:MAG: HD domain-containing protein [Lancefieldella parvula]